MGKKGWENKQKTLVLGVFVYIHSKTGQKMKMIDEPLHQRRRDTLQTIQ
jgi:hypothetical protein